MCQLLRVREIPSEFGMTEPYWRKQVFLKTIAYSKLGKAVVISRDDLATFVATRRVEPQVTQGAGAGTL